MSEKEIKLFVVFLQKLQTKLWTDKLDRLLWYTIWTFHKQYDSEEERDNIIEHITEYLAGWARYIDEWYEEDEKYEKDRIEHQREVADIMSKIWTVIRFFTK